MIKLYIYCSVLIFGSVEVGPDIEMTFHQKMIEITSYDTLNRHLIAKDQRFLRGYARYANCGENNIWSF